MAQVHELEDLEEWKQLLKDSSSRPVMLFKHSTRCPVSAEAHDEFMKHTGRSEESGVDYALVLVVENRNVSNAVSDDLGVKHESPQALLIRDGKAVWHDSHWRITEEVLKQQVSVIN